MGCHALFQGIFPTQGWNLLSLMSPVLADGFFSISATCEVLKEVCSLLNYEHFALLLQTFISQCDI